MKIIIPQYSGFCPGVKAAEKTLFRRRIKYIYGDLIHNKKYIAFLSQQGIQTVHDWKKLPKGERIATRTHGIARNLEQDISSWLKVIDLTCVKVKQLQLLIHKHSENGHFIVIAGKKTHPEVEGLTSYAKGYVVIENSDDLTHFLQTKEGSKSLNDYSKILIVSQTTAPHALFDMVRTAVNDTFSDRYSIRSVNSICPVTTQREACALKMQKQADISLVIGDRSSSNANKLYKLLKEADSNTYFVEDLTQLKQLNIDLIRVKTAMVVSSSSTPDFVEREIIEYLKK